MTDDDVAKALAETPGLSPLAMLEHSVPLHRFGCLVRDRTAREYEEVLADHRRLVRELDVLLHGDDAARQASLCDLIGIVRARRETALELANKLEELGVTLPGWQKNAYHYFPHTSGKVPLYAVETFFDRAVNLAERVATFLKAGYRR